MQHQDIQLEICGDDKEVAVIRLTRGAKRNALSDGLILALRNIFEELPSSVRAAVIDGEGPHFCAGLDLSELKERDAGQGLHHSRMWHAALERVQYGPVPVVAALHGDRGTLKLRGCCGRRAGGGQAQGPHHPEAECRAGQSLHRKLLRPLSLPTGTAAQG